MFETVSIVSLTGAVLWANSHAVLREDVVSALIRDVVLTSKARGGSAPYVTAGYTAKWAASNAHGLLVVAVIAKALANSIPYTESYLNDVRDAFVRRYGEQLVSSGKGLVLRDASDASSTAEQTLAAAAAGASALCAAGAFGRFGEEAAALLAKYETRKPSGAAQAAPVGGHVGAGAPSTPTRPPLTSSAAEGEGEEEGEGEGGEQDGGQAGEEGASGGKTDKLSRLEKMRLAQAGRPAGARRVSGLPPGGSGGKKGGKGVPGGAEEAKDSPKKVARTWDDNFSYDNKKAASLDKSKDKAGGGAPGTPSTGEGGGAAAPTEAPIVFSGTGASQSGRDLSTDTGVEVESSGGWLSSASSWIGSLGTGAPLTAEDLAPVVDSLRAVLQSKNVATEVTHALCDSIASQLVGTRVDKGMTALLGGGASRLSAAVTAALRSSIERVLTPTAPVDILREVRSKRAGQAGAGKRKGEREPYVIAFCGVNGVGKSTTLSKIAFHLKDHGHTVLLAACDSFRAGAVEQLKKHAERLTIGLYEAGYAKDPVAIASAAIRRATEEDVDVVLVDTAGRMQNNAQLMAQLAKLVSVNRPDRVLFVGEALVGNDGVDQLMEFNRALTDLSQEAGPRASAIHGIVLTKFDTVDDKVGAALSMTYKTGIPIVFLGVGQQYPDLRKLNTAAVVRALLT